MNLTRLEIHHNDTDGLIIDSLCDIISSSTVLRSIHIQSEYYSSAEVLDPLFDSFARSKLVDSVIIRT